MRSRLIVVYDACVLYPAPLRDLLMQIARADLYHTRWTDMIHEEWTRNVLANNPHLTTQQLDRTRQAMNDAVPNSVVSGFETLIPTIKLPDENDRHVVAAAIHCNANLIVTFNLKDFPARVLKPYKLGARHPDDFIVDLLEEHQHSVVDAVAKHRARLRNPPKTVNEYLDTMHQQGLTKSVAIMRHFANEL